VSGFEGYDDLHQVAVGSTAVVFRARQVEVDRVVAVKELLPAVRAVPGLLARFRAEAALLASLDDPHVVRLLDYLEDAGRAWLVQEWVPGASLTAVLARHGRLSPEQSLGVLRGGLLGLAHAHDRGVVHRDIAPGNVLLDAEGVSKLVDFGLAAPVGSSGVLGTPAFVSPEVASGQPSGTSGDVYSAAAVLFLLLTGRPPFAAPDPRSMLRRHVEEPVPVLTGHGPRLADLLSRALAKDPARRPSDARAFLAELEDAAEQRYGAAWLTRASVAGLVASASAAGVAGGAAGLGGAGGAPAAAATVHVTAATADTGVAPAPVAALGAEAVTGRRPLRSRLSAGAVAAAVVVVGVGAAVVLPRLAGDGGSADRASTSGGGGPSSTATPLAALDAVNGAWVVRYEVVGNSQPEFFGEAAQAVGQVREEALELALRCTAEACTGPIVAVNGSSALARYDRTGLTASATSTYTGPCVDAATGAEIPNTSATITQETTTQLSPANAQPGTYEGTQTVTGSYSAVSPVCEAAIGLGPFVLTSRITMMRT
jgi:serine/threonine-protein kinase